MLGSRVEAALQHENVGLVEQRLDALRRRFSLAGPVGFRWRAVYGNDGVVEQLVASVGPPLPTSRHELEALAAELIEEDAA